MKRRLTAKIVLERARKLVANSGLTYQQIGERMGYPRESARQSVGQFLRGTNPTVSMLIRFAEAMGVEARELL